LVEEVRALRLVVEPQQTALILFLVVLHLQEVVKEGVSTQELPAVLLAAVAAAPVIQHPHFLAVLEILLQLRLHKVLRGELVLEQLLNTAAAAAGVQVPLVQMDQAPLVALEAMAQHLLLQALL
jgi:hypothetical protein